MIKKNIIYGIEYGSIITVMLSAIAWLIYKDLVKGIFSSDLCLKIIMLSTLLVIMLHISDVQHERGYND